MKCECLFTVAMHFALLLGSVMKRRIDELLNSLLNDVLTFSVIKTSICIKLSNYAVQQNGCRSIFQLDESKLDSIEEEYSFLMKMLDYHAHKCIEYLSEPHEYNDVIYKLDDLSLEHLLENTLFEMIVFDSYFIFAEQFFKGP